MLSLFKGKTTQILKPIAEILARFGIKPNHLTLLGLFFGFISAYEIYVGNYISALSALILSSLMDALDGALARTKGMVSDFGGFLDSVLDRYVDIAVFFALGFRIEWFIAVFALTGALMVSYTRARAEKVIERCDVGIAERGERLILIMIGLAFPSVLNYIVLLVGILAHATALHRIIYTYKKL